MATDPKWNVQKTDHNKHWLRKILRGEPHLIVGKPTDPYLLRWYVIPRNRFLNIYLHHFMRSDDDRALHDHPWWFASLILTGGYREHRESGVRRRSRGSIAIRNAEAAHRVELYKPCWTLIFTGPKIREWGFHCPKGWVFWEQFVNGNGCGEYA